MTEQEQVTKIEEIKKQINNTQSYMRKRDLEKYLHRLERELREYRRLRYGIYR